MIPNKEICECGHLRFWHWNIQLHREIDACYRFLPGNKGRCSCKKFNNFETMIKEVCSIEYASTIVNEEEKKDL